MKKVISFSILLIFSLTVFAQLDAGQDTTICNGETIQLNASGASNYYWTSIPPDPTLSDPYIPNPTVQPDTTTMYIVSSQDTGINLVPNGDFELGNVDFTSEYIYNPVSLWNPGTYAAVSDANTVHQNFFCDNDHTSGNGLMMCANGAITPNVIVWSVTIDSINPNTEYQLSTWVSSLSPIIVAVLQFKINGIQVGQPLTSYLFTCVWKQFSETWDSGNDTVATITIINQTTADNLNDFALDDISFANIVYLYDTVIVNVIDPPTSTFSIPESICSADTTLIQYTGNGADTATYHWDFDGGNIINGNGQGPFEVQWETPGSKQVTLWVEDACNSDTTTQIITVNQSPSAGLTANATSIPFGTFTYLHGEMSGDPGPFQFNWQPSTLLLNPESLDPQTVNLVNSTEYIFTVSDESSSCQASDTIFIEVTGGALSILSLTATPDTICEGDSSFIQVEVSGGSGNYTATWTSDPPGFEHTGPDLEITVIPDETTTYYVSVNDGFNTTPTSQAEVFVHPLTTITTEPSDQQVLTDGSAIFEVLAEHVQHFQWQVSKDNGVSWQDIDEDGNFTGTNTGTLTITTAGDEMDGWLFRCLLSGKCTLVISTEALLSIVSAPAILNELSNAETCMNDEVLISYNVANFIDITNMELVLQYDEQFLSFTGLSDISADLTQNIDVTDMDGRITIQWSSINPVTIENGLAFKIGFIGLNSGITQLIWNNQLCVVINVYGYSPELVFTGSEITIKPLAAAPEAAFAEPDSVNILDQIDIKLWADGGSGDQLQWLTENCEGEIIGEGNPLIVNRPEQTTTYFVRWVNGCGFSTCQNVSVIVEGEFDIYAPSAFSPNGDGLNDEFTLVSPADLPYFRLQVFDRWGKQIFESEDIFQGWDGTYKGKNSPVGTYVWKAVYRLQREGPGSEEKVQTGTVVIIR